MKVEYFWPGIGVKVREFTLKEHGEKFEELAKEFCATQKGRMVPDDHVPEVKEIPDHLVGKSQIVLEPLPPKEVPKA